MSIQDTLLARQERYGEFIENATIAQNLKDELRSYKGWDKLSADKKESLDMIMTKTSRILSGNPEYPDNWHDIGGFAKLVENMILTGSCYKEPREHSKKKPV